MQLGLIRHLVIDVAALGVLRFDARGRAHALDAGVAVPEHAAARGEGADGVAGLHPVETEDEFGVGVGLELDERRALALAAHVGLAADHREARRVAIQVRDALIPRHPTRLPAHHPPAGDGELPFPVLIRHRDVAQARAPSRFDTELEARATVRHIPRPLVVVRGDDAVIPQDFDAIQRI